MLVTPSIFEPPRGTYVPYPNPVEEAKWLAEWQMLTKPESQLSAQETGYLKNLYPLRTRVALVTSGGAHSFEKREYRDWLAWCVRPNGVVEKGWTRSEHRRMGTDEPFLSAIVRRNGPGTRNVHMSVIHCYPSYDHRLAFCRGDCAT